MQRQIRTNHLIDPSVKLILKAKLKLTAENNKTPETYIIKDVTKTLAFQLFFNW